MSLPSSGLPTANQVADWAISIIGRRIDLPGSGYGSQCCDLVNYIFERYWHFRTPGNARDMAWYKYYPSGFKVFRNTRDFVPQRGDFAVWTQGNYSWNTWGHTDIVVGPATKDYFYGVDQNWYNSNSYNGSPAAKVKHSYTGVTHFIRPAYKEEPKPVATSPKPTPSKPVVVDPAPQKQPENTKPVSKIVKRIKYTVLDKDEKESKEILDHVAFGEKRVSKVQKILVKNANSMDSVKTLYKDRNTIFTEKDYPHYFVDRYNIWSPRSVNYIVPDHKDYIVVVICEDLNTSNDTFNRNELSAMILIKKLCNRHNITFNNNSIVVDKKAWRTLLVHQKHNIVRDGNADAKVYIDASKSLFKLYDDRNKILNQVPKDIVEKIKIKTFVKLNKQEIKSAEKKEMNNQPSYITKEMSSYSLESALNIQMRNAPQVSNGVSWFNASKQQVKGAMNTNNIFKSASQVYQFLRLDKYQGLSVEKLNEILKGKGTLSGKGQAFADACKENELNEIYLIAHAILESESGTSNYASGRYGIYNFFGIGAFDANPDNAIRLARNHGWTTPEKAIKGGAKFVREGFINKGQNTLYRMRWNPKNPGMHQYATDIKWASHQATIISNYYSKINLKGKYFIYDQYK
ncbi:glucosaminidase domain-containing protein [Mammaliicoccus sciuri]|uniref:glucosaminidase domain-containing protein n=1 Tax=Mammaliicoccus sciuri TaxID=1296 RepID=UPI0036ECFD19